MYYWASCIWSLEEAIYEACCLSLLFIERWGMYWWLSELKGIEKCGWRRKQCIHHFFLNFYCIQCGMGWPETVLNKGNWREIWFEIDETGLTFPVYSLPLYFFLLSSSLFIKFQGIFVENTVNSIPKIFTALCFWQNINVHIQRRKSWFWMESECCLRSWEKP